MATIGRPRFLGGQFDRFALGVARHLLVVTFGKDSTEYVLAAADVADPLLEGEGVLLGVVEDHRMQTAAGADFHVVARQALDERAGVVVPLRLKLSSDGAR